MLNILSKTLSASRCGLSSRAEDAPESLTLADDLDGIIHVLVNLVGVPEHVLGVEHLDVLDDSSVVVRGESLTDGGVDGSLATLAVQVP